MKRMICFGAQVVPVTTVAASMPDGKIPCRRAEDYIETRGGVSELAFSATICNLQVPLFATEDLNLTAANRSLADAISAY